MRHPLFKMNPAGGTQGKAKLPQRSSCDVQIFKAVLRLLLQHPLDNRAERGRSVRSKAANLRYLALRDPLHQHQPASLTKEPLPREAFPEHHPKGKLICTAIDLSPCDLLRRHVGDLAFDGSGQGLTRAVPSLGDAKVCDLHLPRAAQQYIVRADITMNQLQRAPLIVEATVRVVQTTGGPLPNGSDFRGFEGQTAPGQILKQRPKVHPVHVLHRDKIGVVHIAKIVDRHHVGMSEAGRQPSLVRKHGHKGFILGEVGKNPLNHHLLGEALGSLEAAAKDLSHPSSGETFH